MTVTTFFFQVSIDGTHFSCPFVWQKHFAEVMVKFRKFQRPAEFEPKLSHVKRELDGIQERIHLLEVPSADPVALQERHDACMVGSLLCVDMTLVQRVVSCV